MGAGGSAGRAPPSRRQLRSVGRSARPDEPSQLRLANLPPINSENPSLPKTPRSPGGYQLFGRTLPIYSPFGRCGPFTPAKPWLLEFFDQVRFYQVSEAELEQARALRCAALRCCKRLRQWLLFCVCGLGA